jgi:NADH dehydrogenase FAD-containing subunit
MWMPITLLVRVGSPVSVDRYLRNPGQWVVRSLEKRGGQVHLNTELVSARDGHVVLSTGEEFDSGLIVWTAGKRRSRTCTTASERSRRWVSAGGSSSSAAW